MTNPTQTQAVLHLLKHAGDEGITALDALKEVGTMRLAHHVHVLRGEGYDIATKYEGKNGKRWGRYILRVEPTLWGNR